MITATSRRIEGAARRAGHPRRLRDCRARASTRRPSLVLCSSARRTVRTLDLIAPDVLVRLGVEDPRRRPRCRPAIAPHRPSCAPSTAACPEPPRPPWRRVHQSYEAEQDRGDRGPQRTAITATTASRFPRCPTMRGKVSDQATDSDASFIQLPSDVPPCVAERTGDGVHFRLPAATLVRLLVTIRDSALSAYAGNERVNFELLAAAGQITALPTTTSTREVARCRSAACVGGSR